MRSAVKSWEGRRKRASVLLQAGPTLTGLPLGGIKSVVSRKALRRRLNLSSAADDAHRPLP
jgi:hypothetical protein